MSFRGLWMKLFFPVSILLFARAAWAQPDPPANSAQDAETHCQALAKIGVSAAFENIYDAPTMVSEAKLVRNAAELVRSGIKDDKHKAALIEAIARKMQPFCRVRGYVTPNVGFELLMPVDHWNGKFLHLGCGGWCGSVASYAARCALTDGYACIGTDMGHTGQGGLWMRNNNLQAQIDFSYRATHVVTLAGKAIVEWYYAKSPKRSYFSGCSTGGYQAMVEAQRFPRDFDGIIAGAPDMDESDLAVRDIWIKRTFFGNDGRPVLDPDAVQLVHQAALAKCDMDDGVKDGIISDPLHCKFDPTVLQCKTGQRSRCLTASQVEAVKNIYGPPLNSKGEPISTRLVFPGSELNWKDEFEGDIWGVQFFRDSSLLSPPTKQWTAADFDFDRDYKRSGVGVLFPDTNPDLRKFKAAGGKLLGYQGGYDAAEYPGAIVDYYETVERTMGGRAATQDFYRLFIVPGMDHCWGGDGAFAIDYLSYLDNWVEKGQPPDVMIGAHLSDSEEDVSFPLDSSVPVTFTRPVYPFPLHAKYKGTGDPNSAMSFVPAAPAR